MKKIFPSNMYNQMSLIEQDQTTAQKLYQSQTSKAHFSMVPSEANQTFAEIIEKNKLQVTFYGINGRFVHIDKPFLGLKPKADKLKLLEEFLTRLEEMAYILDNIQNSLLSINFKQQDFQQVYNSSPENLANILFKDIKTLEGIHLEIQFQSSFRFLETVLEALDFNPELAQKLYAVDTKLWAQKCYIYLNQFISQQPIIKQKKWCCI